MNQDNMLFGQLNQEIELLEYIGEDTDTAKVTVDGKAQAIAVDVKKVPNKLVITEDSTGETLIHEFDGSSETLVDLTGYAKEEATQEKLDAKRDKIVRDETQDPQYTLVYSQNTNGVESSIPTTTSAVAGSIPIRNANGNLIGYQAQGQEYTPFSQVDAIAKTKVAKITIPSGNPAKVYGANSAGETSIPVDKSALADAIAWRNAKGNLVGNDATADNEYTILSQVNAITQKEVADLGADIDGRLYEVEEDVQTKYDNSVHRTKLPSNQAARVYTEYYDTATGTSKQGSTAYSPSAQAGYFAMRTSNGQLNAPNQATYEPSDDQFVSKRFTSAHYVPINGNSTITGNLAITGDLAVSGTTTTEHQSQLFVDANVIATNSNKQPLQTALSGLAINKNETSTYGIMYDPSDDTVKFGEGTLDADNKFVFNTGEGHPLAIRADSSKFTDTHLVKWDADSMSFVDAGISLLGGDNDAKEAIQQKKQTGTKGDVFYNTIVGYAMNDPEGKTVGFDAYNKYIDPITHREEDSATPILNTADYSTVLGGISENTAGEPTVVRPQWSSDATISFIAGKRNINFGKHNAIFNTDNIAYGADSFIAGLQNIAVQDAVSMLGMGLIANKYGQVVVGRCNEPDDSARFIVGGGWQAVRVDGTNPDGSKRYVLDSITRKNLLTVNDDGDTHSSGRMIADGAPVGDTDVTRLKELNGVKESLSDDINTAITTETDRAKEEEEKLQTNINGKVDKLLKDDLTTRVYAQEKDGTETFIVASVNADVNTIPLRDDKGNITAPDQTTDAPAGNQFISLDYADGRYVKGALPTIGTSTSSTDLKKIVYTADADIPATPEEGVEYAVTDFISEADLDNALATKINNAQEKLTFDTTPTSGSTNPVTSGGIYDAISKFLTIQVSDSLMGG